MAQQPPKKKKPPMNPRAKAQRLEMLIGILGFFTAIAFVSAAVTELRGEQALVEALVLVFFLVCLWLAVKARRDIFR